MVSPWKCLPVSPSDRSSSLSVAETTTVTPPSRHLEELSLSSLEDRRSCAPTSGVLPPGRERLTSEEERRDGSARTVLTPSTSASTESLAPVTASPSPRTSRTPSFPAPKARRSNLLVLTYLRLLLERGYSLIA